MKTFQVVVVDQYGSHTVSYQALDILDAIRQTFQNLPQPALGANTISAITATTVG
jgi:hypothetical protein